MDEYVISKSDFLGVACSLAKTALENGMAPDYTATLIMEVHSAMAAIKGGSEEGIPSGAGILPESEPVGVRQRSPEEIQQTMNPDYLVSLEDGRRYKSLKRHLATHDLTPKEYREKWGLPADYPMVCENYSKARSELARRMGLGKPKPAPKPARVSRKSERTVTGRKRAA